MLRHLFLASYLLGVCFTAEATDLLIDVPTDQARKLEEYNGVWLQKLLYPSARYRIVAANYQALLEGNSDITVKLFNGDEVTIVPKSLNKRGSFATWIGELILPEDLVAAVAATAPEDLGGMAADEVIETIARVTLTLKGYDVDPANGSAKLSPRSRSKGRPGPSYTAISGQETKLSASPPRRPQYTLDAFYALEGTISVPQTRRRYHIEPLRFTPKYSVLFELDSGKVVPVNTDTPPEEFEERLTPEQRTARDSYREFLSRLPAEQTPKSVREDIQ